MCEQEEKRILSRLCADSAGLNPMNPRDHGWTSRKDLLTGTSCLTFKRGQKVVKGSGRSKCGKQKSVSGLGDINNGRRSGALHADWKGHTGDQQPRALTEGLGQRWSTDGPYCVVDNRPEGTGRPKLLRKRHRDKNYQDYGCESADGCIGEKKNKTLNQKPLFCPSLPPYSLSPLPSIDKD